MLKLKKIKHLKLILIIMAILIIPAIGITFSKYLIEEYHSYYLNSKNFYFTSNRLKENTPLYQVNNWSGVGSFTISFDLLSLKNTYTYTDYDIPYQVTYNCPNGVTCSVNKPVGTIYSSSANHADTVTLTVNPNRNYVEGENLLISISAQSTAPFIKTISANFKYVVGKQGVTYEIEDEANRTYLLLKISNALNYCTFIRNSGNYTTGTRIDNNTYRSLSSLMQSDCISQIITIGFNPNTIVIDTTNDLIDRSTYTNTTISGISYVNNLEFNIDPLSTLSIKFYKNNPANDYTYPYNNNNSIINVTIADPI